MDQQTDNLPQLSIKLSADGWIPTFEIAADLPRSFSAVAGTAGDAPEEELTLFALRLAILEKSASGISALGFIWATVVLLGGFAITLERKDFWFVTVILLVEGARIFSRSHELKWQHQATWSLAEAGAVSFRAIRAFCSLFSPSIFVRRRSPEAPPAPYSHGGWGFISRSISRLLYWLQLVSASECVVLSLMRLAQQDYGEVADEEDAKRNRRPALNIFYGLALSEALLFLAERAYFEWNISHGRLLEKVNRECGLGPTGVVSVRRFFYDAYSRCINGSIFDGMRMDMVTFSEELLGSGSRDEQLIGARILVRFATNRRFADTAMRKIGTSPASMERLVEMLNWKSPGEEEIRRAAAVVVSKLAGKKQNALRVAGISGAMDSISSLLYTGHAGDSYKPEESSCSYLRTDRPDYEYSTFNLLGLVILKKLAKDHDNCGKIGSTRGLLPKIIHFTTGISQKLSRRNSVGGADPHIQAANRALQVLKMLSGATGRTGQLLRRDISEIVFTICNVREILQHGEEEKPLQKLGVEILTRLAMDGEARENIGATGGLMRGLMRIFFDDTVPAASDREICEAVRVEAGEALAMLLVENSRNCTRVLAAGEMVVDRLVQMVGNPILGLNACRILRNLCAYGEQGGGFHSLSMVNGVVKAFPMVLHAIMFGEMKQLEIFIGFAVPIVRLMSPTEFTEELERANILETELIQWLVHILQKYNYPSIKTPQIRRYVTELSICLMMSDEKYIKLFYNYGMIEELQSIADTTIDLECFIVFSGCVGLTRHRTTLASLVENALEFLLKDMGS